MFNRAVRVFALAAFAVLVLACGAETGLPFQPGAQPSPGPSPFTITTTALPQGMEGEPYIATIDATGGSGAHIWSIAAGFLPAGLAITPVNGALAAGASAQAVIDGTLSVPAGVHKFTLAVTDESNAAATRTFTLTVIAAPPATVPAVEVREGSASGPAMANGDVATGGRDFGAIAAGASSAPLTIVIVNTGGAQMTLGAPALSGSGAANFALGVAGIADQLAPGTGTSFTITASPASGQADATLSFTHNAANTASPFSFGLCVSTAAAGNWYDSQWLYRRSLAIAAGSVTADLANFPVLVSIASSELCDTAHGGNTGSATGDDILFTAEDGVTRLDHEIESYDPAAGMLLAWVRVPLLASGADTVMHMYYGNAWAAPQSFAQGVWGMDHSLVLHLNTPAVLDSSLAANHGTPSGFSGTTASGIGIPSKIGGGVALDGANDHIVIPDNPALDLMLAGTWSFWIRTSGDWGMDNGSAGASGRGTCCVMARHGSSSGASNPGLMLGVVPSGAAWAYAQPFAGPELIKTGCGTSIVTATWRHVAFAFAMNVSSSGGVSFYSGVFRFYVDGVETKTGTFSDHWGWPIDPIGRDLRIGRSVDDYWEEFKGSMDEIRVCSVERSPAWIHACYLNQNDPAAFCADGGQVTKP